MIAEPDARAIEEVESAHRARTCGGGNRPLRARREPDTPDLGQLPEPIQQSQPIQQPQQQSQPIQQPANLLPPSFEPKPITAEISLVADPATGEVR